MDMLSGFMSSIKPQKDGDMVDRLNYCYSTIILAVFAIFISGWSFVGTPIQCWFPAYYKGWWVEYALDYCYVQNTYFLPFTEGPVKNHWELNSQLVQIPKNISHREEKLIGYYQWVPFILALEAILFYMPVVFWRSLYESTGMKVKAICDTATNADNMKPETRRKNIKTIANFIDHSILVFDQLKGPNAGRSRFISGRFITALYIFIKLIFALNCIVQFFMLQHFLGLKNFWWGSDIFMDLINGREWMESAHFPRVTMCDFEVRVLGNLHQHTVQCVLMINMFNEKIFVFLWWWFILVGFMSCVSFLYWLITSIIPMTGRNIVLNYLSRVDKQIAKSRERRAMVRQFMDESLKPDGILLLRLIAANAGDMVASELLEALWNKFNKKAALNHTTPLGSVKKDPNNLGNPPKPSAPSVKLAGRGDYPTLPLRDPTFPPSYEASLDDVDQPRQRKPEPNVRESDF